MNSAMASLGDHADRDSQSFRYWTAGIESLALADALSSTANDDHEGDQLPSADEVAAQRELLSEAMVHTVLNAHDPGLSVQTLADHLNVSRAHLHFVSRPAGLTPAVHIWRVRAGLASDVIQRKSHSVPPAQVAALSGFSSARSLRSALCEQRQPA